MPTVALNDFGTFLAGIGSHETPSGVGFADWSSFTAWVDQTGGLGNTSGYGTQYVSPSGAGTFGAVVLYRVFQGFQQRPNGSFPTAAQVAASISLPSTSQTSASEIQAIVNQDATFAATWFYAQAPDLVPSSISNPAPPVQPVTASSAGTAAGIRWAQAQNGVNSFRPPSNSLTDTSPSQRAIPNEWIVEGPTTFPDGTGYLIYIYGGIGYQGAGGPVPQVLWYQTSSFVPLQVDGNNIQIPGTGSWYLGAIVYGDKRGNEPPPGWNGAYVISQGALSGLGKASSGLPGYADVPQVTVVPSTYVMNTNRTDNPIAIVATNDPNAGTIPPGSTSNGSNSSFSSPTGSLAGTVSAVVAGAATTPAPGAVAASSMTVVFFLLALVVVLALVTSRRPKG